MRKRKRDNKNKGYILAVTLYITTALGLLLLLITLSVPHTGNVYASYSRYKARKAELDRIGCDFASDFSLDCEYDEQKYETVTDGGTYIEVYGREKGDLLLTVRLRDGKVILWRYGDDG